MLYLQSFLRKGVSLGHVRRNQNLKDLKETLDQVFAGPETSPLGTPFEMVPSLLPRRTLKQPDA